MTEGSFSSGGSVPTRPLTGQLLIAAPSLVDPHFRRGVILLLDHDGDGSLGVIINRPTPVAVSEVLPGWSDVVSPPDVLFSGGPVATDSALAVGVVESGYRSDAPLGWRPMFDATGLVDLDSPPELVSGALGGMRIFAGYAGWSAGQLEAELEEGSWYVVDALTADLFTDDPENLWRTVLRRQPGDLRLLTTFPDDPTAN